MRRNADIRSSWQTWHGIKKLCCGFWDKDNQLKYTDYVSDTREFVDGVVKRMESEQHQIDRLWFLFLKAQGSHLQ
jgi:hypothetical protein